jgi:hypothetical protein
MDFTGLSGTIGCSKSVTVFRYRSREQKRKTLCNNNRVADARADYHRTGRNGPLYSMAKRDTLMDKQDRRRRPDEVKAATKRARIARASARRRVPTWLEAAASAEKLGHPLNVALHITWSALIDGERREGHVLGLPAVARERRLWSALRLVAARARVPWLAARGPEYDQRRGLHLHMALHLPDAAAIRDAIAVVERLTGAPAERLDMRAWTVPGQGKRQFHGTIAVSGCNGWLMQRRVEALKGGGKGLLRYAAKGDGEVEVEGQHRLSNELVALVRQAA